MICIYCTHSETDVINSRPLKQKPSVWRRRRCQACNRVFTTDEVARATPTVISSTSLRTSEPFNIGMLTISIWRAFQHDPQEGERAAGALAQTIAIQVAARQSITTTELSELAHRVMQHYDTSAAVAYALQHHMLTSVKRRGRPSLAQPGASDARVL